MTPETIRHLHLVGATGKIRTATFNGTEHLAVPVVGMVEGVVWAVNSETPELVLAEELAVSPQQWNGRACFAGHPKDDGTEVTANTPNILEKSFGVVFHTNSAKKILEAKQLEFTAYLDPTKAKLVGPEAEDVIRRLQAGETVEVSVGCYVRAEETDGQYNGKEYHGVWRDIVSDHLAFLAADEQGACSVAAGCGAARSAVRHLVSKDQPLKVIELDGSIVDVPTKEDDIKPRSLRERFADWFRGAQFDTDLRAKLDRALRETEPGFMGIDNVDPDAGYVYYSVMPTDEWKMLRRRFSTSNDSVELTGTSERVEPELNYKVITATGQPDMPCTCKHVEGKTMKAEVRTLIDNSGGKYTDADATWLDAVPTERLSALAVKTEAPAPVAAPTTAEAKPLTEAEVLKIFPHLGEIVTDYRTNAAAEKDALVEDLKTAQTEYTEDELKACDLKFLKRMQRMIGTQDDADFSQRGVPRAAETRKRVVPDAPDPYKAALEARNNTKH